VKIHFNLFFKGSFFSTQKMTKIWGFPMTLLVIQMILLNTTLKTFHQYGTP